MKNLANCKPSEFLKQTYRIKGSIENWIKVTDLFGIRKRKADLEMIQPDMSDEERHRIFESNKRKVEEQSRKNMMDLLDAAMGEHPDETLEVLALCCFVEPENVDDHTVSEYLGSLSELLGNKDVISFFTSLAQLGLLDMSNASDQ